MNTHFFGDTGVLLGRSLKHITRSLDTIITTAIMPVAFLLLFVYVFGGAVKHGSGSYVTYLLPGILLITIASGISYTAYRLFLDMKGGIFERFQSMPIARSSVLWSHVLTSLVANLISLAVVVGVALLMGFRSGAGILAWLAIAGILILFTLALTWIAVIPGLSAKSADGVGAFSYPLIFLPFISSAFVPTHTMPGPVRAFAEHQPVTSIANAIRDLFTPQPVGSGIWIALAWMAGIGVVAYTFALGIYRHKNLVDDRSPALSRGTNLAAWQHRGNTHSAICVRYVRESALTGRFGRCCKHLAAVYEVEGLVGCMARGGSSPLERMSLSWKIGGSGPLRGDTELQQGGPWQRRGNIGVGRRLRLLRMTGVDRRSMKTATRFRV